MKAKDYLMRTWRFEADIERKLKERERLHLWLARGLEETPPEERDKWRGVEKEVAALSAELEGDVLAICRAAREVKTLIDGVEDLRYRRLLELRYRHYMRWEAIAQEMDYELRHIYRLHHGALKCVQARLGDGEGGQAVIECHPDRGA